MHRSTQLREIPKEIAALFSQADIDPTSLLPTAPREHLDWTIKDTFSAFANAVRICMMEECPVKSLHFDIENLDTDDVYVLPDNLAMRLHMIPIHQEKDYTDITIELDIRNPSRKERIITSGDLMVKKKGKLVDSSEYFGSTIHIMALKPSKYIKLTLPVVEGLGSTNAGKFSNMPAPRYAPEGGSLDHDPDTFHFGISTHRNCSSNYIINAMHKSLVDRLTKYRDELKGVEGEYASEYLKIEIDDEVTLTFPHEYMSIPALLAQYCYRIDPTIDRVSSTVKHLASNTGIIKIKHATPFRLLRKAIDMGIEDLTTLRDALMR
jgi:DNA-directed RNA polymerase subunit L